MNKKILAFLCLSGHISLFACGGCVDAPQASQGAQTINSSYDSNDSALASAFQEQVNLVNETLNEEIKNQNEYNTMLYFEIDTIVNLQSLDFYKNVEKNIRKNQ